MYPEDLKYYTLLDSVGRTITHYPWAGDVYNTYMTRYPVNRSTGDPSRPSPLFGHGPDFGYFYYGAIWYGDELWNGGALQDYNEDDFLDDVDALVWDERHNSGNGFREWEFFEHPTLGMIEIGGFHPKFFAQNGPSHQLEHWVRVQGLFNIEMAFQLPQLKLDDVVIEEIQADADSSTYSITVAWTNTGRLPTALKQAQLVKIVQEDRVILEFDKELVKPRFPEVRIISPSTFDKTIRAGYTDAGESKSIRFDVRLYGIDGAKGKVRVLSTRGGLLEAPITLGVFEE